MLQKRKNISIAGLYVCPNSIFWVTGALYCACFTDPGDGGYNDFITGERKKSRNEHRRSKMGEQGHEEPTGQAKITKAYNLPCRYVLHTVGPIVQGKLTEKHCALLRSCYLSCLELASAYGLESVAFCCISTGVFCFPNDKTAQIAVQTVQEYLEETPDSSVKNVIFNVFKNEDLQIYERILRS